MLLATVVVLAGMAVLLWATYREPVPVVVAPAMASWGVLPAPADVARATFPTVLRGYDPAAVDAHLQAAARAYADLLAAAPPDVVARARERAAARLGWTPVRPSAAGPPAAADQDPAIESTRAVVDGDPGAVVATSVIAGSDGATTRGLPAEDRDALRAASVLGRLEDGASR